MKPRQLSFDDPAGIDVQSARLKIKVRPTGLPGPIKAIAMVTIASAITIYPVRVMQGRNGLFVAMPQRKEKSGQWKDIIYPKTKDARDYLQYQITHAYNPSKEAEVIVQGYVQPELSALVVPVQKAGTNLVAMASITVQGEYKIDGISVYRNRDNSLKLYYPKRQWDERGEKRIADCVLLTDDYQEKFLRVITEEYVLQQEQKNTQPAQQEHNRTNQFHDFQQRDYSAEEMMEIERTLRGF